MLVFKSNERFTYNRKTYNEAQINQPLQANKINIDIWKITTASECTIF